MDDLLAARSQMAISLAFHIIFGAIGIAMPLLMIVAEWKWLRSKDEIYLTLPSAGPRGLPYCLPSALFRERCLAGAMLLFPSYYYLFRIFKRETS
jgi:cytochrome d ubiquinol oxidase subunit I